MALRNILKKDDPTLRKHSREVTKIDGRIQTLIDDMLETMEQANGAGLAAPQVGVLRRIVVMDVGEGPIVMINPVITSRDGEQETVEGCLSLPNEWALTRRPMKVTAEYLDRNGKKSKINGEGLLAKCICHEVDHLEGKLFTDDIIRMVDPSELERDDEEEDTEE